MTAPKLNKEIVQFTVNGWDNQRDPVSIYLDCAGGFHFWIGEGTRARHVYMKSPEARRLGEGLLRAVEIRRRSDSSSAGYWRGWRRRGAWEAEQRRVKTRTRRAGSASA